MELAVKIILCFRCVCKIVAQGRSNLGFFDSNSLKTLFTLVSLYPSLRPRLGKPPPPQHFFVEFREL